MRSGVESDDSAFAEDEFRSGFEVDELTGEEEWIEAALRGNVIDFLRDRRACDLSLASRVDKNAWMEVAPGKPYLTQPCTFPMWYVMAQCHNLLQAL